MELHTYTDLWRQQRRIHAIQDIPLPRPIPAGQLGAAVAAAVVWIPLMTAVGVPAAIGAVFGVYDSGVTAIALAGPPIALAWLVGRPLAHHQTAWQLAVATARYVLSPPRWHRLGDPTEPHRLHLAGPVWIARPPDANPPPMRLPRLAAPARWRRLSPAVLASAVVVATAAVLAVREL